MSDIFKAYSQMMRLKFYKAAAIQNKERTVKKWVYLKSLKTV